MGQRGHKPTLSNQTPNTVCHVVGVSLREIISAVKRETAQTVS
jgi:hypothetical protein